MSNRSTFREQFIAEIDQIRQLRRRYWLSITAIPIVGLAALVAAAFVHPILLLLVALPAILVHIYSKKVALVKCPRCGELYNGDPKKPADPRAPRSGWKLLGGGTRCVHCDFAL